MKSVLIPTQFHDAAFSDQELRELSSSFIAQSRMWTLTLKLVRKNWWRAWLFPIIIGVGVTLLLALLTFGIVAITTIFIYVIFFSNTPDSSVWGTVLVAAAVLISSILYGLAIWYVYSYIYLRVIHLINNATVPSFFAIKKHLGRRTLHYMLFSFSVGLIMILPALFFGILSYLVDLMEVAAKESGLVGIIFVVILSIISSALSMFPSLAASSIFGYGDFKIAIDEDNGFDAIVNSFTLVKPYYWRNIARWAYLGGASIVISILPIIFVDVFSTPAVTRFLEELDSATVRALVGIVFVLLLLLIFIAEIALLLFSIFFKYVSFVNLRLLAHNHGRLRSEDSEAKPVLVSLDSDDNVAVHSRTLSENTT